MNFSADNSRGQAIERAFESLLTAAGVLYQKNPYTGTADPRRADYDHDVNGVLVEEKANYATKTTGNVAIEVDILEKSKAAQFLIAFPTEGGWHARMLDRADIYKLLTASKMGHTGRVYRYLRTPSGEVFPGWQPQDFSPSSRGGSYDLRPASGRVYQSINCNQP